MMINNYDKVTDFYTKQLEGTGGLAFRDIPCLIRSLNIDNNKALDFGCGAGRSTRILSSCGLDVTGVDINKSMINEAGKNTNSVNFILMEENNIPFEDCLFDIVFNSFVLFDMPTRNSIIENLSEMARVCVNGGYIISIVNSDYLFTKNWVSVKNNFPENKNLSSGNVAKIYLSDVDILLKDYFWTDRDYRHCFNKSNLKIENTLYPLARKDDNDHWLDETKYPPYCIYVCKKV